MQPFSYNVVIKYKDKDGNDRILEFNASKVIYDEGGNNSIRVETYMTIEQMKVLDYLEQSQQVVTFSFEPVRCSAGDLIVECPNDVIDYFSDNGQAKITWELMNSKAIVHIHRITGGEEK